MIFSQMMDVAVICLNQRHLDAWRAPLFLKLLPSRRNSNVALLSLYLSPLQQRPSACLVRSGSGSLPRRDWSGWIVDVAATRAPCASCEVWMTILRMSSGRLRMKANSGLVSSNGGARESLYADEDTLHLVELEDIVASPCETHELIDNALRSFLGFTTTFKSVLIFLWHVAWQKLMVGCRGIPSVRVRRCAMLL